MVLYLREGICVVIYLVVSCPIEAADDDVADRLRCVIDAFDTDVPDVGECWPSDVGLFFHG